MGSKQSYTCGIIRSNTLKRLSGPFFATQSQRFAEGAKTAEAKATAKAFGLGIARVFLEPFILPASLGNNHTSRRTVHCHNPPKYLPHKKRIMNQCGYAVTTGIYKEKNSTFKLLFLYHSKFWSKARSERTQCSGVKPARLTSPALGSHLNSAVWPAAGL